jgi:hypothetical protein
MDSGLDEGVADGVGLGVGVVVGEVIEQLHPVKINARLSTISFLIVSLLSHYRIILKTEFMPIL